MHLQLTQHRKPITLHKPQPGPWRYSRHGVERFPHHRAPSGRPRGYVCSPLSFSAASIRSCVLCFCKFCHFKNAVWGLLWQSSGWAPALSLLGGLGSNPGQGTKILQVTWCSQKSKNGMTLHVTIGLPPLSLLLWRFFQVVACINGGIESHPMG